MWLLECKKVVIFALDKQDSSDLNFLPIRIVYTFPFILKLN